MNEDIFQLGIKALIRNEEGKILLLQVNPEKLSLNTNGAYWDIPGGRIHTNSTVEETLKREVEEETGIKTIGSINKLDMVLSNIRIPFNDTSVGLILGIYICEVDGATDVTLSDEHIDFKWFVPKEAADLLKVKYPSDFCSKIAELT